METDFVNKLAEIVGSGNLTVSPVDCLAYSRDMSIHVGVPQAIVFAADTEQVSKVVASIMDVPPASPSVIVSPAPRARQLPGRLTDNATAFPVDPGGLARSHVM